MEIQEYSNQNHPTFASKVEKIFAMTNIQLSDY